MNNAALWDRQESSNSEGNEREVQISLLGYIPLPHLHLELDFCTFAMEQLQH